ncbi:hypothetical protein CEXT_453131 [Caerostris extrusa]|uniref:Pre-C2HC domain-containing protein n=1 Tax=Caerostris extrusa TaxID=172846 RepID=A0AAV4QA00_CAEEX|nr:hypothetical protein CEXT_453131 [Caerostris extrusa]
MKNKLVHLGLEFKCFNLKQDRPVKVMIKGLPACTPKEDINFALSHLGFKILAVNQLLKGNKWPMPLFYILIANILETKEIYNLTTLLGTRISIERIDIMDCTTKIKL